MINYNYHNYLEYKLYNYKKYLISKNENRSASLQPALTAGSDTTAWPLIRGKHCLKISNITFCTYRSINGINLWFNNSAVCTQYKLTILCFVILVLHLSLLTVFKNKSQTTIVLEIEKGWCIFHESVMNIKRVLIIQIQCWHFVTQETMYICKQHTYSGNDSWYMHFNIKLIYIIAWKIEMAPSCIFQFRVNLAIHK